MYHPNFCSECGIKILRLHWHFWTSRKFCNDCARRLRKQRFVPLALISLSLLGLGYVAGRTRRPPPPPLTIIRRADSPLTAPEDPGRRGPSTLMQPAAAAPPVEEEVYLCGARTKKGTPCSRRVHGPKRCWQHKGAKAMLPQEKLLIRETEERSQ